MAGQQDEFERVAMPHTRSLLRAARRLTSNSVSAEDLVQDAMLSAWRGFHQFQPGTNVRAWLFRILFNAFYAQGRKLRAAPAVVPIAAHAFPADASIQASLEVNEALDTLTVEHRAVLMLGIVEGFTCQEIAEILGVPMGTVMSRLSRARDSLRHRLESRAAKTTERCTAKGAT